MRKKDKKIPIIKIYPLQSLFASLLTGIIFAGLFSASVFVFATPPTSQYSPGETLDPSCSVGDTNCSTVYPVPYTGATAALNLGAQNLTTTGTSALGATTNLKYDSTNYTTLTAASNGDLTIATTSATTGGNINISSAIAGDFTMLSNSGTLVLGGTGNSNNENLKLDFETYANKVAITSGTSVADIDFGALNIATTGTLTLGGSTAGTLVTRVKAGAATESDTNGSLVIDSSNGRLYFRYGSAWHYIAQTAGFQIPAHETIDMISGEEMKLGDLVLGMISETDDGREKFSDGGLHAKWIKWDSVKADLLAEARGELSKLSTSTAGALPETFSDKVKNGLFSLGISIQERITHIKDLTVETFSAKTAKVERLQMLDKATGGAYCTWIENGEWMKAKGECGSVEVAQAPVQQMQQQMAETQEIVEEVKQDLNLEIQSQVTAEVKEQIQEQIEEEIQEQVKEEVQEQIQEEVQSQGEPVATEDFALPSIIEEVMPPVEEEIAPESTLIDDLVQETAAALMDNMILFAKWLGQQIIPISIENSSESLFRSPAALWEAGNNVRSAIGNNTKNNAKILSGIFFGFLPAK